MKPLDSIKKLPGARALIREVKKTQTGRTIVGRAADVIRGMSPQRDAYGVDLHAILPGRHQDFQILRTTWRDVGPTESMLTQARELSGNTLAWDALHPATWIVFAAALLESGDEESAEVLVRRYVSKFGAARVAEVLPLARFAHGIGVRSPEVIRAWSVAEALAAEPSDRFARLVSGKTVAVVGNGPGELGTSHGKEIDAHDVVIRFNNYPGGYESDYGVRTDVWVRGAHSDVRDRHDLSQFRLVLWEMDLFRNLLEHPSHLEILYRDTLFAPAKVSWIDTETKRTLRDASGLTLPTSGAQVLWALHRARDGLEGVDVYGFSSITGDTEHGHYFDTLGDMGRRHDVAAEGAFLRDLLGTTRDPRDERLVVFNCAYRNYDPARGRTGGPAGVLATQRLALGDEHQGRELRYIFDEGDKGALKYSLPYLTAGLTGKPADLALGGEYVRTHPEVTAAIEQGRKVAMVCHDLGSALGARLLGVPYVIVYHQQGSTLQEMRSIGRVPTDHETAVVTRLEEFVCAGALRMHFPSAGAREAFERTADPALRTRVRFSDDALYNTLSAVDHAADVGGSTLLDDLAKRLDLPAKAVDLDIFMSVGDWNGDKGLDRVPGLLSAYRAHTGRRVLWIAVGSASDPARFAAAKDAQKAWPFESRLIGQRMTHDRLIALLDYADIYVMMHRQSIFDLATLEAMRAGKGLVLTPVGGNVEVNLDDNVEYVNDDTVETAAKRIAQRDLSDWGASNRAVYEQNFSLAHFAERYRAMLDELIMQAEEAGD